MAGWGYRACSSSGRSVSDAVAYRFPPPRPTGVRAPAAATSPTYSEFARSSPALMVKGPLTRIALSNGLACLLGRSHAGWSERLSNVMACWAPSGAPAGRARNHREHCDSPPKRRVVVGQPTPRRAAADRRRRCDRDLAVPYRFRRDRADAWYRRAAGDSAQTWFRSPDRDGDRRGFEGAAALRISGRGSPGSRADGGPAASAEGRQ